MSDERTGPVGGLRPFLAPLVASGLIAIALLVDPALATRPSGVLALAAVLLLVADTVWQRHRRQRAERRGRTMASLQAREQTLTRAATGRDLAASVAGACRRLLGCSWLELRFEADELSGTWHMGPDGEIAPEGAVPPRHPPPLPGVHRRADWEVLSDELAAGHEPLARLRVWCDPRRLDDERREIFPRLTANLAREIHRAVLDRRARHDPLTGVPVRRVLDEELAVAFQQRRGDGGRLAVIVVDLDWFKSINDRLGHAAGDEALRQVARALQEEVGEAGLVARYGGEEFIILCDGSDGTAGLSLAERLRVRVGSLDLDYEGDVISLTLSAGVAAFPEIPCRSPHELVVLADEALYEAKAAGRDRCLLHLGAGRFVGADGELRESDTTGPPTAPRIFA